MGASTASSDTPLLDSSIWNSFVSGGPLLKWATYDSLRPLYPVEPWNSFCQGHLIDCRKPSGSRFLPKQGRLTFPPLVWHLVPEKKKKNAALTWQRPECGYFLNAALCYADTQFTSANLSLKTFSPRHESNVWLYPPRFKSYLSKMARGVRRREYQIGKIHSSR